MATIRFKSYGEGDPVHVMFGNDITEENWIDIVLDYLVGSEDVDYSEDGNFGYEYEHFETKNGTCVSFRKGGRTGDWDWRGNPCGEFEFDPEP